MESITSNYQVWGLWLALLLLFLLLARLGIKVTTKSVRNRKEKKKKDPTAYPWEPWISKARQKELEKDDKAACDALFKATALLDSHLDQLDDRKVEEWYALRESLHTKIMQYLSTNSEEQNQFNI